MKISESFKHLNRGDLPSHGGLDVVIDRVVLEEVTPGIFKPVVYFTEKSLGFVLDGTIARELAKKFGDETDDWPGKPLKLLQTRGGMSAEALPAGWTGSGRGQGRRPTR